MFEDQQSPVVVLPQVILEIERPLGGVHQGEPPPETVAVEIDRLEAGDIRPVLSCEGCFEPPEPG